MEDEIAVCRICGTKALLYKDNKIVDCGGWSMWECSDCSSDYIYSGISDKTTLNSDYEKCSDAKFAMRLQTT